VLRREGKRTAKYGGGECLGLRRVESIFWKGKKSDRGEKEPTIAQ